MILAAIINNVFVQIALKLVYSVFAIIWYVFLFYHIVALGSQLCQKFEDVVKHWCWIDALDRSGVFNVAHSLGSAGLMVAVL